MKVCRDPDYYILLLGLGTTQEDLKLTNSSQDRPLRYLIHFLGGVITTHFETFSCQKLTKYVKMAGGFVSFSSVFVRHET